ncbi:NAD-dependent epimerase/dehydratase family protein [Actinokineospora sp.]|uniref:NAD-dependent epimerase/dehydratase family protein n=1 Tax=Actinokineospora sp. TaxID=1872133 RepID=UPI0040380498
MRLLVLGGTRFLGRAVAAEAVRRGHDVVCAARGESGAVPEGATLVKVDRGADDGLVALAGERFDAAVDVATISYPWVRRALDALRDQVGHWTFISSISVYSDFSARPTGVGDPVLPPREEQVDSIAASKDDPDAYGSIKVASENAVRAAFGDRALIVRAGLITGPDDLHDRFGYWPARMVRGGRVVVPDADISMQYIDVRDLAAWIVDSGENGTGGTFDAAGPAVPLRGLLRGIADAVGGEVELVPVSPEKLAELKINPWAGPRSLPLWLPESHRWMGGRDMAPALAAGLTPRALVDAVAGALAHERALGLDRERRAGLTAEEEAEILAAL